MAQENKNPNWIKWVFAAIVLVVLAWAIYAIVSKNPAQQQVITSLNGFAEEVANKTVEKWKETVQDERNPLKVAKIETDNLTVKKDETVEGNSTIKGNQIVEKDQTIEGNVTVKGNETVEGDQTVEGDSTIKGDQRVEGDQFINGNQTIGGCQKQGSCGASAPVYPSCTSNCSSEGQSRCVAGCLTGDQREVCVRSGSCLIWQRQDCASGQYCDNGTCRTRAVAPTVTERKCWYGDVYLYTNGVRQGLVEDCGETQYFSATEYRCSGNNREWKERVERGCVETVPGQAYCRVATDSWRLSEYCSNGCYNNACKPAEVIPTSTCTSGCCSGNCGGTTIINDITIVNNPPAGTSQTVIAPPAPPTPPAVVSQTCTQNCNIVDIEKGTSSVTYNPPAVAPAPTTSGICTTCVTGWSPN